jgi:RNA-binding protein Luc7-like 2
MDEQRALLDQLMGKTRDLTEERKKTYRGVSFRDRSVCKNFVCGMCPYTLFVSTKSDLGTCPYKVCGDDNSDALACRDEYNSLSLEEKEDLDYEYDLMCELEDLIRKCDRKIAANMKKMEHENETSTGRIEQLAKLQTEAIEHSNKCEVAFKNMNFESAYLALELVESNQKDIIKLQGIEEGRHHISVCDVCGNYVNLRDTDDRMRSHFEGKQYVGWKAIRERFSVLKEKYRGVRGNGRKRERDWDRDRDKDRDRGRRDRGSRRGRW